VPGISPAVAQTLVEMGVEMGGIVTMRNLQDGLRECIRYLESTRVGGTRRRSKKPHRTTD
jgi:rsbT co-antagonist protein RsbR